MTSTISAPSVDAVVSRSSEHRHPNWQHGLSIALLAVFVLACGGGSARESSGPVSTPSAPSATPQWPVVDYEAFAVAAPQRLSVDVQQTPTPSGEITTHAGAHAEGELRFAVAYIDFPPNLARSMDRSPASLATMWGKLLGDGESPTIANSQPIASGELAGVESSLDMGSGVRGLVRSYWVGDSLFLVAVVGPGAEQSPGARYFLESFALRPSWRQVSGEGAQWKLSIPRTSQVKQSSANDGPVLYQFLVDDKELCRLFVMDTGTEMADLEIARKAVFGQTGLKVLRDDAIAGGREVHLVRANGQHELARLFTTSGRIYIVSSATDGEGSPDPDARRCVESFAAAAAADTNFLRALVQRDLLAWKGFGGPMTERKVATALGKYEPDFRGIGKLGESNQRAEWVAVAADGFPEGLKLYSRNEQVVLAYVTKVELSMPVTTLLERLGPPEARLDAYRGTLPMEKSEWIYPSRGLALYVDQANQRLFGLVFFSPTTLAEYRDQLRLSLRTHRLPVRREP